MFRHGHKKIGEQIFSGIVVSAAIVSMVVVVVFVIIACYFYIYIPVKCRGMFNAQGEIVKPECIM